MVVVESAVVEGLGRRSLGTPQLGCVSLAFVHCVDDIYHVLAAAGILICSRNGRAVNAEIRGDAALGNCDNHQRDDHYGFRYDALGIQYYYHRDEYRQRRNCDKVRNLPVGVVGKHLLGTGVADHHQDNRYAHCRGYKCADYADRIDRRERAERHNDQDEADQEAEAVRDHVSEVEAVPDVVELTDNAAEEHEENQSHADDLLSEADLRACQREEAEEHRERRA